MICRKKEGREIEINKMVLRSTNMRKKRDRKRERYRDSKSKISSNRI